MKKYQLLTIFAFSILLQTSLATSQDTKPTEKKASQPSQADLEKKFSEHLSGSALVGQFSIDGQAADKPARPERYELESVTKLRDNYWVFLARIKYGKNDVKIPITLQVLWAGDTPIISMTDVTIPGMGTFTARVMFYGDRYAGTWQHGKAGGHMWGMIDKSKKPEEKKE